MNEINLTDYSTRPSAYFNEDGELIAIREIHKDDEITINYSILEQAG